MTSSKLRQSTEGLTITAAGVLFTVLSMGIRNNPVPVDGAIDLVIQAKFFPLLLSLLIALQGLGLTIAQWNGKEKTGRDGGFTPRALTVVFLTVAYLALVYYVGFVLPTIVYITALLFLVDQTHKKPQLLALSALYSVITLLLIPRLLNLQLL